MTMTQDIRARNPHNNRRSTDDNVSSLKNFRSLLHPPTKLKCPLPRNRALSKSGTPPKRTSRSPVPHAHDAHILDTGNRSLAGHPLGHLNRQGKVPAGRQTETLEPEAGDVLRHFCGLESRLVCSPRGAVDGGFKRAGTVLVDLPSKNGVNGQGQSMLRE